MRARLITQTCYPTYSAKMLFVAFYAPLEEVLNQSRIRRRRWWWLRWLLIRIVVHHMEHLSTTV